MLGPDVAFDSVTSTMMSGKADTAFFASLPVRPYNRKLTHFSSPSRYFYLCVCAAVG